MIKQIFIWFDTFLATLLAIVLLAIIGGYAWLSYKPRDISQHVPQILSYLNIDTKEYGIKIAYQKVLLKNAGLSAPLMLQVEGFQVKNLQGANVLKVPKLRLTPSFQGLLNGRLIAANLEISGAKLDINQNEFGEYFLQSSTNAAPLALADLMNDERSTTPSSKRNAFNLKSILELGFENISVIDARTHYSSALSQTNFVIPSLSFTINSALIKQEVRGNLIARYQNSLNQRALLQANFTYLHRTQELEGNVNLVQVILSEYSTLAPQLANLNALAFPLTGRADISLTLPEQIRAIDFDLVSPEMANLSVAGTISGTFNAIFSVVKGSLETFDIEFLKNHWPTNVAPDAYDWIKRSIKKAIVSNAEFNIDIKPDSFSQPVVSAEVVKAILDVEDAEIDYVKGFPLAKKASGRVIMAGQSFKAEIDEVSMLSGTHLTPKSPQATIFIPDLLIENIEIIIDVPLISPLRDVIRFLESTPYKVPSDFPLNAAKLQGELEGKLVMKVLDRISPAEDEVDFKLDGNLRDVSYSALVPDVDLTQLNGTLQANNQGVKLESQGQWNKRKFTANVHAEPHVTRYKYKGNFPYKLMGLVSNDAEEYASGTAEVDGSLVSNTLQLDADLTDLTYNLPYVNLTKNAGVKSSLSLKGDISKSQIKLNKLVLSDNNVTYDGSLSFSRSSGDVQKASFNPLKLGKTTVSGDYAKQAGQHVLNLNGSKLDLVALTKLNEDTKQDADTGIFDQLADIPPVKLDISLDTVLLDEGESLNDVKLTANCIAQRCKAFDFSGLSAGVPITAKIGSINGKRNFTASIPNLGRVLRDLDIFDDMRNGMLTINAVYQDDLPNRPMVGRLHIDKFNVRDVPLLARLLTVATFTGVLDSLSGGGMYFEELELPFRYDTQSIDITNAKAVGPSIGVTAKGSYQVKADKIEMDGVLIPAKLFDTVLSGIPIIGNVYDAITGGQGLIALNYSMRGKSDNLNVTVNPLSALTPGFLRGLFNMGAEQSQESKEGAQEAKEAVKQAQDELDKMESINDDNAKTTPTTLPQSESPIANDNNLPDRFQPNADTRRKRSLNNK